MACTSSWSVKKALARLLSLLGTGPFVSPHSHQSMSCYLHYNLLINVVLIQLRGSRGPQGVIGIIAGKASKPTHVPYSSAEPIHTNWAIHIPCLSEIFFSWLKVECIAGTALWQEQEVLDNSSQGASITIN